MESQETTLDPVRGVFCDVDPMSLSWETHCDFIIRRILSAGSQEMLYWLQRGLGDDGLSDWLLAHQGGGLAPRQLRFWQLILDLPESEVDRLVKDVRQSIWGEKS